MRASVITVVFSVSAVLAAPVDKRSDSDGNSGSLMDITSNLEGYIPILGGNNGPLIPGAFGSDKKKRSDSDGNSGSLMDVTSNLEGYLPVVGGNNGPLVPGAFGSD